MAAPVIGITTSRWLHSSGVPQISIAEAYVQAVLQAGACPVMLALGLPQESLDALLARLDGILFSGGGDIEPGFYGAGPHPKVSEVDADRDRIELYLLERAVESGLPFLGICRGFQLVNVGLGGSLYADIREQHPGAARHDFYPDWPRDYLAHAVQILPESRLAEILAQDAVQVNSLHHQGVETLAPGLVATGRAPDGLAEAVELPGHPFGLAVQWHPEWLTGHPPMRALFRAFVQAAGSVKRDA